MIGATPEAGFPPWVLQCRSIFLQEPRTDKISLASIDPALKIPGDALCEGDGLVHIKKKNQKSISSLDGCRRNGDTKNGGWERLFSCWNLINLFSSIKPRQRLQQHADPLWFGEFR